MKGIDFEILQVLAHEAKKIVIDPLSAKDVWLRLDRQMRSKYGISNVGTRLGIMIENGSLESEVCVEKRGGQVHYKVNKYWLTNPDHWLEMHFKDAKEIHFSRRSSGQKDCWIKAPLLLPKSTGIVSARMS